MTARPCDNRSHGREAVRRRRLLVAAMFTVLALIAFASGAAVVVASQDSPRAEISAARTLAVNCRSPALAGTLPALIYLPPGYAISSARYRVIYFLHGLPAGPESYKTSPFVASALAASARRAIVVAPQGARAQNSDREYLDWDPREDWPAAISHDLPRCIDRRFRTIPSRSGRALIGLSAGGYGAFNIGLRTLATFGAVESWSGYFAATDPSGYHVLNLGSVQANRAAQVPSGTALEHEMMKWPTLLAFYVGAQDSRFLRMNRQYAAALTKSRVAHLFRVYPGGHSAVLWRSQAQRWLGIALDSMAGEGSGGAGLSPPVSR
jgi:enterochelin esterase-like enzyme